MSDVVKKRRLENTTVACPIVFGSIAFPMGKKAVDHQTHRWTLFVRGPNDEDLSCFVSKIIFSLHPSFAVPLREITSPPYEVTELGWGEFEAGIRIFFRDPEEKPVDLLHMLRLYPEGGQNVGKKPVITEYYDEIVFTAPAPSLRAMLMQYTPPTPRPITWLTEHYTVFNEETDLQRLMVVQDHVAVQLDAAKAKLLRQEAELGRLSSVPASSQPPQNSYSHAYNTQPLPTPIPMASASQHPPSSSSTTTGTAKKKETKAEKDRGERERAAAATAAAAAAKKKAASAKAKKEKADKEKADKIMKDKVLAASAAAAANTASAASAATAGSTVTGAPSSDTASS